MTRLAIASALAVGLLNGIQGHAAGLRSPREELSVDANWKFFTGDPAGAEASGFDDSKWQGVTLPHDWSIEGVPDAKNPTGPGGGYFPSGIGWYRKTFRVPQAWKQKRVSIEFDGVASNATVYLNGVKLGVHPYAYTTFRFDLTPGLNLGGTNMLAVRVDNSEQPASRWYTGAGIYRHVRIVVTNPVHVVPWGIFVRTSRATELNAVLLVQAEIGNDSDKRVNPTVKTTIYSPGGKAIATDHSNIDLDPTTHKQVELKIGVDHPRLWSTESPKIYRAVTEVMEGGKVIDRVETSFGIRTLAWSAEKGLLLNDQSIKLAGGSIHHDNGPLGAAAFNRAEERKAELLKAAGFNAVRSAHNPPSPAFLNACDRIGLLVLDEAFDAWTRPKVIFDYSRFFNDWWQRDIDSMVLRDRNHPSVIFWSIGNEIPEAWTKDGGPIAKKLAQRVRSLDDTRPLTGAFPGATYTPDADATMSQVDVSGYNYNLSLNHKKDHQRVPDRLMMSTESLPPAAYEEWRFAHDAPYIIGEFVWASMDYLGESGAGTWSYAPSKTAQQMESFDKMLKPMLANMGANGKSVYDSKTYTDHPPTSPLFPGWPWHGAYTGDLDLTGHRKPQSYYRDILWNGGNRVFVTVRLPEPTDKKIVAIGWTVYPTLPSWTWPGQEGKTMQVEVYAGTEKVRLYLNDKLIDERPTDAAHQRRAIFDVAYTPGVLRATGVIGETEVASETLQTAGVPTKLNLKADRTVLQADGEDLSFITVEANDSIGQWQPNAAGEVQFEISGPGTIVAVGNGDEKSVEPYRGNRRSLFEGRALVIVRASRTPGAIRLKAVAHGLAENEVTLHVQRPASKDGLQ